MEENYIVKIVYCRLIDLDSCMNSFIGKGYTCETHQKIPTIRKKEISSYQKSVWVPPGLKHVHIDKSVPLCSVTFKRKRTEEYARSIEIDEKINAIDEELTRLNSKIYNGSVWLVIVWPILLFLSLITILTAGGDLGVILPMLFVMTLPSLALTIYGAIRVPKVKKNIIKIEAEKDSKIKELTKKKTDLQAELNSLMKK